MKNRIMGIYNYYSKSDNKSYLITTRKIFRSDLAIHFKRKPGAELSGFICEFDKIDAGKSNICVL